MKKTLLAAAVTAAALSTSAIADTKLSGQVNYIAGALEDFNGNEGLTVTDAGIWSSRFRITSYVKDASGIKYGLRIEYGIGSGAGNGDNGSGLGQRVNEFYLKGSAGKLSVGLGSEASDGALEKEFSGTYSTNNSELESFGLATLNDDQQTPGNSSSSQAFGVALNGAGSAAVGLFPQLDGGRTQRIRYDTPKLGGVASLSFSYDTDDTFSARVDAGGKGWGFAAFGTAFDDDEQDNPTTAAEEGRDSVYGASFGFKAFGGFTGSIAYAEQENQNDDEIENIRVVIGYRTGKHSVAVDYVQATFDRDSASEVDNESFGLGYVYRATKGVELYASIRQAESDLDVFDDGSDDTGTGFLVGSRIVF